MLNRKGKLAEVSLDIKHEFIEANGIRFHYVTAGKGPLVILLHGFPEFWYGWRHQIPALAEHFQVVAPDLRGYGQTERPIGVQAYSPRILADDIAALVHGLGHEKAHIVGHDWGGGVAWNVARNHPEVVDRLVVLNCPHPAIFGQKLRNSWKQIKKSWYIFFFQIPYLPEMMFKTNLKKMVEKVFVKSARNKNIFTDNDLEQYRAALEKPGALTAALNYYRAVFRSPEKKSSLKKQISAPTLLIWGEDDMALGKELTYNMEPLFSGNFLIEYVPNCSHWVNEEKPDLVNQLLIDFLS